MQPMTVTEIASAVKGVWWNPSEQVPVVSAVSTDSRRIVPGSLFLPWVGEKFDGHLFIDAALSGGDFIGAGRRRRWLPVRQAAPEYPGG